MGILSEALYDTHISVSDAASFARQMVALGYYTQNHISIGYCAKIAGMCEEDFIRFLGQHGIGIFDRLTEEELMKDMIRKLAGED